MFNVGRSAYKIYYFAFLNYLKVVSNHSIAYSTEVHIPPLLGVAPLGPLSLSKECYHQIRILEAAQRHMPHPSDSERLRYF